MTALIEQWQKSVSLLDQALTQLVERDAAREARLRGIEHGLRVELGTLSTEIRTERTIGDHERKALHLRVDRMGGMLEQLLRDRGLTVPPEVVDV